MISMSDDLLERLDAQARANRETRSGFLQRLAERELESAEDRRRIEVRRLLDELRAEFRDGEPRIDAARLIREDRESH
jgi:predicted DNA-binding protein